MKGKEGERGKLFSQGREEFYEIDMLSIVFWVHREKVSPFPPQQYRLT